MILSRPIELPRDTRCLVLNKHPRGKFSRSDFKIETRPLPLLVEGRVFCKTLAISIDPNMRPMTAATRRRKDDEESEIKIGDIMFCVASALVIASRDDKVPVGTYGYVHYGACEYGVASRLDHSFEPFTVQPRTRSEMMRYLSVYSYVTGLTAYHSVFKVLELDKVGPHSVLVVSGARGSVGSLVGQMAKSVGATVIGITSSEEKALELMGMGFDGAVNYKSAHIHDKLKELAPLGITHYHDNVGGECTAAVLANMAPFGKISVCGCISEYTRELKNVTVTNWDAILTKRLTVKGFVSADHLNEMPEFLKFVIPLVEGGQLLYNVDVREGGLDEFVSVANDLFRGKNQGKLVLMMPNGDMPLPLLPAA